MIYIYLVGKPCSGKDTVSRFLTEEYGFSHLMAGHLVKKHITDTYGPDSKELSDINKGLFVDDTIADRIAIDFINKSDQTNILFDGYPRTINQFNHHMSSVSSKIKKIFIILNVDDEEAIRRSENRLICSSCTRSQIKTESNQCAFCMSENSLYKRKDDSKQSMQKRLEVFTKITSYVFDIKNNSELNLSVYNVDANKSVNEILKEIDSIINKNK